MSDLFRPTFEVRVAASPRRVAEALEAVYRAKGSPFVGQSVRTHLTITLARAQRHFWSPWLHLDVNEVEGEPDATDLFARFSPAPSVWTAFMLGYIALLTIALFAGVWAVAQWMLDRPPTMLYGVAGAGAVAGVMVWSARVGQRLARGQMALLREAVESALGEAAGRA